MEENIFLETVCYLKNDEKNINNYEKLQEYINYRNNEITLVNGFAPNVLDSQF